MKKKKVTKKRICYTKQTHKQKKLKNMFFGTERDEKSNLNLTFFSLTQTCIRRETLNNKLIVYMYILCSSQYHLSKGKKEKRNKKAKILPAPHRTFLVPFFCLLFSLSCFSLTFFVMPFALMMMKN